MTRSDLLLSLADCFDECDPTRKIVLTRDLALRFAAPRPELAGRGRRAESAGRVRDSRVPSVVGWIGDWVGRPNQPDVPGRPTRPELVAPRLLPKRSLRHAEGRAALIHAVAHIEFNAVNLALDALLRFPGMPEGFYVDWMRVAGEEADHFALMRERLQELDHDYGDFPAHDGLWAMARQTAGDLLERMALVPRVLEARGLDVTPGMIERLRAVGDHSTADRLGIILNDEIGHVAIGSRWFRRLCEQRDLEPGQTYLGLIRKQFLGRGRGQVPCPLNLVDRRRAGFDEAELEGLMELCGGLAG